jgi:RimJ/RimL family protein N-acetyltransferase
MRIAFRPLGQADLPMLRRWIARPHWREWWGDPDEELGHVRAMVEGRDTTLPYVIEIDGEAAGYIQVWFARDQAAQWAQDYPWLAELPPEAVGVDLSIADADRVGRGQGSAALRAFARRLWDQGRRVIVIDPDRANQRAVRAYAKAGFRPLSALEGRSGDVLIMQYHPDIHPDGDPTP